MAGARLFLPSDNFPVRSDVPRSANNAGGPMTELRPFPFIGPHFRVVAECTEERGHPRTKRNRKFRNMDMWSAFEGGSLMRVNAVVTWAPISSGGRAMPLAIVRASFLVILSVSASRSTRSK
jgi:hypothetical protein